MNRYFYRLLCVLLCCVMMSVDAWAQSPRYHVVMPGETFYSLSKKYGVTVDDIKAANPQLDDTLPCGFQLLIPESSPVVKAANAQGVVQTPANSVTRDPVVVPKEKVDTPSDIHRFWGTRMHVALMLPFCLNPKTSKETQNQARYVEFYEGFLIAVDELQRQGLNIQLKVFDLASESAGDIVASGKLDKIDLIVGPVDAKDVAQVAKFASDNDVVMVNPFTFDAGMAANCKGLFQLNTPKTMLYELLTRDLLDRFAGATIVFMNDSMYVNASDPYVEYLQAALDRKNIDYYEMGYADPSDMGSVDSLLNVTGRVLFVPNSSNKNVIKRVFPYLRFMKGRTAESLQISVLGYPEWQVGNHEFMDAFFDLNVMMFTKLYVNPFDENVKDFYQDFKYWYHKEPMSYYPKYALLGYDMAVYFVGCYARYGNGYVNHLRNFDARTLQNPVKFEQVGDGGCINKSLYLVEFDGETITKHVIE